MDIIDRAQQEMEAYERFRSTYKRIEVEETGYCLFCGEPLPKGKRWCDADCRDQWEKERRKSKCHLFR